MPLLLLLKDAYLFFYNSDIHADAEKNQVWVREKCVRSAEDVASDTFTVFIVPGDIGSEVDRIEAVLRNLVANYDAVCFLPGRVQCIHTYIHTSYLYVASADSTTVHLTA